MEKGHLRAAGLGCLFLLLALVALSAVAYAAEGSASPSSSKPVTVSVDDGLYQEGEVIVVLSHDGGSHDNRVMGGHTATALSKSGLALQEVIAEQEDGEAVVLARICDGRSVEEAVKVAETTPGVSYAQPNYRYHLLESAGAGQQGASNFLFDTLLKSAFIPDDPAVQVSDYSSSKLNQYYLYGEVRDEAGELQSRGANVLAAWDLAKCDQAQTIAILDTGVNLSHEDLVGNLLSEYAYDAFNERPLVASGDFNGDYAGHGTHVAGIAAASANNGKGVAGSSYNARILPIKVFNDAGYNPGCYTSTLVKAYQYLLGLVDEGKVANLHVVNMSLGGYNNLTSEDFLLKEQIGIARDKGILSVCAGGNGDGAQTPYTMESYPSDWEECLAVTALDIVGGDAPWSDFNMAKDISAPGVALYSTYNSGDSSYVPESGTSMASPLVSGIAALLWSSNNNATVDEVVQAIRETADPIDGTFDGYHRWPSKTGSAGAINAAAALDALPNAHISLPDGGTSLLRTRSAQLAITCDDELSEGVSWQWAVEEGTGRARVSGDGVLTGVSAGEVRVTARADNGGKRLYAHLDVTIDEIAIPSEVSATRGASDTIELSWQAAPGAVSYDVMRAEVPAGGDASSAEYLSSLSFEKAGEVGESPDDAACAFADASAASLRAYAYKVVPMGMLDGAPVEGASSMPCAGARWGSVESLEGQDKVVAALLLKKTLGSPIGDTLVVSGLGDGSCALVATGLAGALGGVALTTEGDSLPAGLAAAVLGMSPKRIVVLGGEDAVSADVAAELQSLAPAAQVDRLSGVNAQALADAAYSCARGKWGSTAFIVGLGDAADSASSSVASYAYAAKAPLFVADANRGLSASSRSSLAAGKFERVVIVGDSGCVPSKVESQLAAIDVPCQRLSSENDYRESGALALDGISAGFLAHGRYAFMSKGDVAGAVDASALLGSEGIALLVADSKAEDVLLDVVSAGRDDVSGIVFAGSSTAIEQATQVRIADYSFGKPIIAIRYGSDVGPGPEPLRFTDVDYSSWYAPGVDFVAGRGLMTGYEGTMVFGVGNALTRGELATILWRHACPDEAAAYDPAISKDTTGIAGSADGMFYTAAANWAVKKGVITGFERPDGTFDFAADEPVTFEQLVTILGRLGAAPGELEAAGADLSAFVDGADASEWSAPYLKWAAGKGLVEGYDEPAGKFLKPGEDVARERAATVLMRAFDKGILK